MTGQIQGAKNLPQAGWHVIRTIEMHTCGEPLRIIKDGLPEIKGDTILEKRRFFAGNHDEIRKALMFEPRGHADMYGAVITKAMTDGADFGTFFMHNEGYSTMCGHAVIALSKYVVDSGLVQKKEKNPVIEIDAPAGRIRARAYVHKGKVDRVSFINVPSFLLIADETVEVRGIGRVSFDVAYGGAFYAICDAGDLGLNLDKSDYGKLIDYGTSIKAAVTENFRIDHPFEPDLGFLYGTIFTGKAHNPDNWSRNVCVFAEGEVDRSPTGTGVSARAALHFARGELRINKKVTIESIIGTTMDVEIRDVSDYGQHKAVVPEVTGRAFYTGQNEFWIDTEDPLRRGFILR